MVILVVSDDRKGMGVLYRRVLLLKKNKIL